MRPSLRAGGIPSSASTVLGRDSSKESRDQADRTRRQNHLRGFRLGENVPPWRHLRPFLLVFHPFFRKRSASDVHPQRALPVRRRSWRCASVRCPDGRFIDAMKRMPASPTDCVISGSTYQMNVWFSALTGRYFGADEWERKPHTGPSFDSE